MQSESNKPRNRIPSSVRKECLRMFKEGIGYKKTASALGLNRYTVREYLRRYKAGDCSWAGVSVNDGGDEWK